MIGEQLLARHGSLATMPPAAFPHPHLHLSSRPSVCPVSRGAHSMHEQVLVPTTTALTFAHSNIPLRFSSLLQGSPLSG